MRVILDLQACQCQSRSRGIGRQARSLAAAIARNHGEHEIIVALSDRFPETIAPLREEFSAWIPAKQIKTIALPGPTMECDERLWPRARRAELMREYAFSVLKPDWIHIGSLFEGLDDDAISSAKSWSDDAVAITLHDLIPLMDGSLHNSHIASSWYRRKLLSLKRAELLLAVSESAKREAIDLLNLPADSIAVMLAGRSDAFRPIVLSEAERVATLKQYGVNSPFLIYTPGSADRRKNLLGLLSAFSLLPRTEIDAHQIVIVGRFNSEAADEIRRFAARLGIDHRLVLPGFVPDDALAALYGLCVASVYPSLHEGFGLPALESMACGAPTIGSSTTSIPEVIAREDALFDPNNPLSIAKKLQEIITEPKFRDALRVHGLERAAVLTWDASAKLAIEAMQQRVRRSPPKRERQKARPRLAYFSTLPPEETTTATYSAALLPALSQHYEIDLIRPTENEPLHNDLRPVAVRSLEWFEQHAGAFDSILYHVQNSSSHRYLRAAMEQWPGVVALHDLQLGAPFFGDDLKTASAAREQFFRTSGYAAVARYDEIGLAALDEYPMTPRVLASATGVIVHSASMKRRIEDWCGPLAEDFCRVAPYPLQPASALSRSTDARAKLGFSDATFTTAVFGPISESHRSDVVLAAWLQALTGKRNAVLIFAGEMPLNAFTRRFAAQIAASGAAGRIRVTGRLAEKERHLWLPAIDLAVHLSKDDNAADARDALDLEIRGVPMIVDRSRSGAANIANAVDGQNVRDLAETISRLYAAPQRQLAASAKQIRDAHSPSRVAACYRDALEAFADGPRQRRQDLIAALGRSDNGRLPDEELVTISEAFAANDRDSRLPRLFVDVTSLMSNPGPLTATLAGDLLIELVKASSTPIQFVPVRQHLGQFITALAFADQLRGVRTPLQDRPVIGFDGDVLLALGSDDDLAASAALANRVMRAQGVFCAFFLFEPPAHGASAPTPAPIGNLADLWLCASQAVAAEWARSPYFASGEARVSSCAPTPAALLKKLGLAKAEPAVQ